MEAEPRAVPSRPATARRLPLRRRLVFSLLTTLLFFGLLEGLLAVARVPTVLESRDPFVGFEGSSPLFVEVQNDSGHRVMRTAENKLPHFNAQEFPRAKSANTFRVFCLGGSTTYGHPYDDTTSFAGWLRELLPLAAPQTDWEIINAGGISYASYRVAALMQELVHYQPDLFVVYTGQNEFLEERTYRNLREGAGWTRWLQAAAMRSRVYALGERWLAPERRQVQSKHRLAGEVDAVLDHTVGPSSYQRDDVLRRQILHHYEFNLARMIAIARSAGAKIVFVTPASKSKDCSPFKSQHRDDLSAGELETWNAAFERGESARNAGHLEQALHAYDAAAKIDDRYAELHFRRGEALFGLGRHAEATRAFDRALDEDVCPLRAVSEIPRILDRVAEQWDVPLIDFPLLLKNECLRQFGHNALGEEFFLDHVHPTIEATRLLAVELVRVMSKSGVIEMEQSLSDEQIAQAERTILSRVDAAAQAVALRNLAKVLNWAGKHYEAGPLALRALEILPDDPECLYLSAAYLKMTGKVDLAIEYYRRAVEQMPNYAEAHQLLGAALVERRQLTEALHHFAEVVRIHPHDADGRHMQGAILAELGRYEESLPHYHRALQLAPNDPNLHYNLGFALSHLHRAEEAIGHFTRALALNPEDADAHYHLGRVLLGEGRRHEAVTHFREALRVRPDFPEAQADLQAVEQVKN